MQKLFTNMENFTTSQSLTGCRWCVEGDLRAVGAEQGVPAAADPEGVQAVGLQVAHNTAGTIHPVCRPPDAAVLAVLLGRGLARASESGEEEKSQVLHLYSCFLGPLLWTSSQNQVLKCINTHLRYSTTWWSVGRWSSESLHEIEASL